MTARQTARASGRAARMADGGSGARWLRTLSLLARLSLGAGYVLFAANHGEGAEAKGKISKNFYRVPYENGASVKITNDYVGHGNSPAGNAGPMDMVAADANKMIVAAAAGRVSLIQDSRSECGCDGAYGGCANVIWIEHANGERSVYLHVQQNSVTGAAGLSVGDCVAQGQFIGLEGDVGWTCGDGRDPAAGACVPAVPDSAGKCGRHLHWEIRRTGSDEFMNPMICNISGNIFVDDQTYTAESCAGVSCAAFLAPSDSLDGYGTFRVYQASDSIVVNSYVVQDSASAVLHAGHRVRLLPGIHIKPGGYFRAEIGPCGATPEAACPPPAPPVNGDLPAEPAY